MSSLKECAKCEQRGIRLYLHSNGLSYCKTCFTRLDADTEEVEHEP